MRGIKTITGLRVLAAGHAFVQNLRRGHHEIVTDEPGRRRLGIAFRKPAMAVRVRRHRGSRSACTAIAQTQHTPIARIQLLARGGTRVRRLSHTVSRPLRGSGTMRGASRTNVWMTSRNSTT
jgi:hypothetical protein